VYAKWLKCWRKIDRETPHDKALHWIADSHATHKHPAVPHCLAEHRRVNMQFTPASAP
jgi:hypothetical protein